MITKNLQYFRLAQEISEVSQIKTEPWVVMSYYCSCINQKAKAIYFAQKVLTVFLYFLTKIWRFCGGIWNLFCNESDSFLFFIFCFFFCKSLTSWMRKPVIAAWNVKLSSCDVHPLKTAIMKPPFFSYLRCSYLEIWELYSANKNAVFYHFNDNSLWYCFILINRLGSYYRHIECASINLER